MTSNKIKVEMMDGTRMSAKQKLLLFFPFILTLIMSFVYVYFVQWFGRENGGLFGFFAYWIFGLIITLITINGERFKQIFVLRFGKSVPVAIIVIVLACIPIAVSLFGDFLPQIGYASPRLIWLSLLFGMTNGILEEVFWRGTYLSQFGNSPFMVIFYSSFGFTLWHVPTQLIYAESITGALVFLLTVLFLGVLYGFIAWRSKSVLLSALSHGIGSFLALGAGLFM